MKTWPTVTIQQWLQQTFGNDLTPKVFLELGAHCGDDTAWFLMHIPSVMIHAFEPDPRNAPHFYANDHHVIDRNRAVLHEVAVSNKCGTAPFVLSETYHKEEWTYSSSLLKPKNHRHRFPGVKFGQTVFVRTVTMDSACENIPQVDFIWCDIQGAEGDMVRGAQSVLKRTRYLYTEYSDHEMYEGQPKLADLMTLLGSHWKILAQWPDDILFENTQFHSKEKAA